MSTAVALHARWSLDAGEHEHVVFVAEGIHCAACARHIERAVGVLPGVEAVRVNSATARVSVDWRRAEGAGLRQILGAVRAAGFRPVPLAGTAAAVEYQRERRTALKRLGLASFGMMQAMMYLGALYGATDLDESMAQLMRVAGMVIVTPILFYSGAPFLLGAWRDLTNRRLGMDVPVSIALLLAWLPSVTNTFRGGGEVYFDSVAMFIFFLAAGRFVEMTIRHRSLSSAEAMARSLPSQVTRLGADGATEKITALEIVAGDRFLVPRGGVVAVDSQLRTGDESAIALLDESLITGESNAVSRRAGERIRGGSLNLGDAFTATARASVGDSTLASIVALLERAQASKPRMAQAADSVASWFVLAILLLSALTGGMWLLYDPPRAFAAVLAVLVITCPCALSLATPAALAAAMLRLSRCGILVTRSDAIERLARIDTVVLDKTGTLTEGACVVTDVELLSSLPRERVLAIAAALEMGSSHPLSGAFARHADSGLRAAETREIEGQGIEGMIAGVRWRIGRRAFVEEIRTTRDLTEPAGREAGDSGVLLGSGDGLAAHIQVSSPLRPCARAAIDALRLSGLDVIIASGDSESAVRQAADALGVQRAWSRLSPGDKIRLVEDLRGRGHRVFMVGDGINDGPVLATADVSCAMGHGSAVAQSAADLLLLHERLDALPLAVRTVRSTLRVIRQNLAWAAAYNLAAVPLAAFGLVPPWLAALGMSLSSLGVVLNARRLATQGRGA